MALYVMLNAIGYGVGMDVDKRDELERAMETCRMGGKGLRVLDHDAHRLLTPYKYRTEVSRSNL